MNFHQPINKDFSLLHIGICVSPGPLNGMQTAFMSTFRYSELQAFDPLLNQKILQITEAPDIVFIQIQRRDVLSIEAAEHLKRLGAFVINWTGDVRSPIPSWYEEFGRHIDLTCFSNVNDVETLNSRGVKSAFLQIGYDPNIYHPDLENKNYYSKPVLFFANHVGAHTFPLSALRYQTAISLRNRYGDRFGLYGNGWGELRDGEHYRNQHEEALMYRGGKIAINISHFDYKRYSSDRLFRILGSGIFCLCKRYPEVEIDFINKHELVLWDTEEELFDLIDYYLSPVNEVERQTIALYGYKKAVSTFTFKNMAENVRDLFLTHKHKQ